MQLENTNLLLTHGWINGAEVQAEQSFSVTNPASLESIAEVSDLGPEHARDAIAAATAAFATWKQTPLQDRIDLVQRWADAIEANADDLGTIICSENGKPLREARGEAMQCAALMRWYADAIPQNSGEDVCSSNAEQRNYTI
jgi:succinate-semialdehyde dehydrogenase/glutarate-semialdehyde dehydrogenase